MDNFFHIDKCAERLYKEYSKHNKLIVAVDFDDTVYDFQSLDTNHKKTLGILKECSELGFYIVIFTAARPDRYEFMKMFLEFYGVKVTGVNQNPIELPYGNNGKIYYNILLDDRAGLYSAYLTLQMTLHMINQNKKDEQISIVGK
jgi:hypothetical protein